MAAAVKVTYTLDRETVDRIEVAAARLARPKSQVIREAVKDYYERMDRLSESERLEKLRIFDEMIARVPQRSVQEVDRELNEIRRARRSGGRRTIVEK